MTGGVYVGLRMLWRLVLGVRASDTRLAAPESASSRTGGRRRPRRRDRQPLEGADGADGAHVFKESALLAMFGHAVAKHQGSHRSSPASHFDIVAACGRHHQ